MKRERLGQKSEMLIDFDDEQLTTLRKYKDWMYSIGLGRIQLCPKLNHTEKRKIFEEAERIGVEIGKIKDKQPIIW